MAEENIGISGEQAGDDETLKSEVETATPLEEGKPAEEAKPQEEKPEPGTEAPGPDDFRAEVAKRYGENKTDQEYLAEAWKSYREIEKTYSQASEEMKGLKELISQFGGPEALKTALTAPTKPVEPVNQLPPKIQALVDAGYDLKDPVIALLTEQEIRLQQTQQVIGQTTHEKAVSTFETGLKAIAGKYEHADVDAIKELAFKGAFANLTDAQLWARVEDMASKQHARVAGLVEGETNKKLNELKKLDETKNLKGAPGGGKPQKETPLQAFNRQHRKEFPNTDE